MRDAQFDACLRRRAVDAAAHAVARLDGDERMRAELLPRDLRNMATHALSSLYEGLPIHSSSHVYSTADLRSNGDYAVVQLNPSNAPDCNPVPIPGFKR